MRRRSSLLVAASWLGVAGCSGDSSTSTSTTLPDAESTLTAGAESSTTPSPSIAPGMTTVPTAAVADTPETVAAAAGFELRADGLGDIDFGAAADGVIDAMSGAFGPPTSDDAAEFPVTVGLSFENEAALQAFTSPSGRTVCWSGFCAQFGGDDPSALSFVGWEVFADPATASASLATGDGLTLGRRWSDFLDKMSAQPGGCPATGSGTTAGGIELALQGGQFSAVSESGEYVELLPDPSQVTVVGMRAGSLVVSLEEDC